MKAYSGYIFDLDGTVYLGNKLIPGADEVINALMADDKKVLFLTNKTIESRDRYVEKLNAFGIKASLFNILNPTVITIDFIAKHHRGAKVYVIGEDLIRSEFHAAGIPIASTPEETDIVIVSWDRNFHYKHLDFAYQAIKHGAMTIATNPDRTCPVENGDVPDCGGMIGAIEGTTGKKIDKIIGKPSMLMAQSALQLLQLEGHQCLMIGDRIETDIRMGNEAGIDTALVLSGITKREDVIASPYRPRYILNSVKDIFYNDDSNDKIIEKK